MKTRRILHLALAAVLLARPVPTWAIFGVGDIVYDPSNTAETINVLRQAQQQLQRLGALLGVSTEQLDQLLNLTTAIGNAAQALPYARAMTPAQIQGIINSIPGLEGVDLNALFNPLGQLDIFMGVPLDQWIKIIEQPNEYFRTILVNEAIQRAGNAVGLKDPEIAYVQWYASRAASDQYNLSVRAAVDLSNLLTDRWLENTKQRRVNLQALSAANTEAQTKASEAQTLIEQQHAQAHLDANTNAILLETALQTADANEAAVRAMHAQNQLLEAQNEAARNADALRLNTWQ